MPLQVRCPQCHQKVTYEGNPYRPFCSERCRRMDLGTWAAGGYAIPGSSSEVEEENPSRPQDSESEENPP